MTDKPKRIVVLGLGNPILTDDAVGLRITERLQELLAGEPIPGTTILQSTRAGFELIDLLTGFHHALIIDALDLPKPEPGRLRRLDLAEFAGCARLIAAHEISLNQAFDLANRMQVPMPQEVEIFAIEAGEVRELSEEMTPAVAAVVDPIARQVHARLAELSALYGLVEDDGDPSDQRRAYYSP
ncbi:hydrogenase maturation protease [bacterium]|nr:hydrogenase maturation protease [bacterium]